MRFRALATLLWVSMAHFLCGQPARLQAEETMDHEVRIARLEADQAALKEDVKSGRDQIAELQNSLKEVRQRAIKAAEASKAANDELNDMKWIGRVIMSALAFLLGAVVTQRIAQFMSSRKPPALPLFRASRPE
jgi:septal ring factor EnvC (AmiA/AmiB activator)